MSIAMLYGAPFPLKRIQTKPLALTPPPPELFVLAPPDTTVVERLAEKMREEHYKRFLSWKKMVPWKEISDDRREPWRLNARTALEFLRDHR